MWYVAETKPGKATQAERHLQEQKYPTFIPYIETLTQAQRSARLEYQLKPLFVNYIFVEFDLDGPWTRINNTRGVKHLLTGASSNSHIDNGEEDFADPLPIPVQQNIMDRLLSTPIIRQPRGPQIGDTVTILTSIFEGEKAIITAIQKHRITLILDLSKYPISVHRDQIDALA